MRRIVSLSHRSDVMCLQEMRGLPCDANEFGDFLPGWRWWTSCSADGASGGVATLVSPRFQAMFDDFVYEEVVRAPVSILRCRRLRGEMYEDELVIANVHLVPMHAATPAAQLRRLLLRMPTGAELGYRQEGVGVILGGFNAADPEEGRINARTSNVVYDNCPLAVAMSHELAHWAEDIAPGYNSRQLREGPLDIVSRIGRVFTNCSTADLRACRVHASYVEDVSSPMMTSDHASLCFRMQVVGAKGQTDCSAVGVPTRVVCRALDSQRCGSRLVCIRSLRGAGGVEGYYAPHCARVVGAPARGRRPRGRGSAARALLGRGLQDARSPRPGGTAPASGIIGDGL